MKKSWMIGVMFLGALTAQAQWKITPEAGFNVTKADYIMCREEMEVMIMRPCMEKASMRMGMKFQYIILSTKMGVILCPIQQEDIMLAMLKTAM